MRSIETRVQDLQRTIDGEEKRLQDAVEQAVATRLKAAVAAEEETKAIRYSSFRQGVIMGEANARADLARQYQDLLSSAVGQICETASNGFVDEFSKLVHSVCDLADGSPASPFDHHGNFNFQNLEEGKHGEVDEDMTAQVLEKARADGIALARSVSTHTTHRTRHACTC